MYVTRPRMFPAPAEYVDVVAEFVAHFQTRPLLSPLYIAVPENRFDTELIVPTAGDTVTAALIASGLLDACPPLLFTSAYMLLLVPFFPPKYRLFASETIPLVTCVRLVTVQLFVTLSAAPLSVIRSTFPVLVPM
jgi:hypothetical protein